MVLQNGQIDINSQASKDSSKDLLLTNSFLTVVTTMAATTAPFHYSTDLSLRRIQEISATIDHFEKNVVKITPPGSKDIVYIQHPQHEVGFVADGIKVWRVSVYILDLVISYNPATTTIALEAFANIPIVGQVSVGEVTGSLADGLSLQIGYPGVLSGSIGIKLNNGTVYLTYDFTAFSWSGKNEFPLFTL